MRAIGDCRVPCPVRARVNPRWQMGTGAIYIGYLTSYEGLGTARISCVRGCSCEAITLDGHVRQRRNVSLHATSLPVVLNFSQAPCVLRAVVLKATHSGGHKFKLTALTLASPRLAKLLHPKKMNYYHGFV